VLVTTLRSATDRARGEAALTTEVTHRVFFQTSGVVRPHPCPSAALLGRARSLLAQLGGHWQDAQGDRSPSFCLDFWQYRHLRKPPPAAAAVAAGGAGPGKPARASRVTLYKAVSSKIVQMWVGKDEEGVGKNRAATIDDILVSDTFSQCLELARREGANGTIEPVFNNYSTDTVTIQ
jgi:hypothetical protein